MPDGALQDDFLEESIRRQQFFSASGDNPEYHSKGIQELKDGKHLYEFSIESGRKYHKIVMETETQSKSVHAFVDKKTVKCTNRIIQSTCQRCSL